jgi:hypothetical protein
MKKLAALIATALAALALSVAPSSAATPQTIDTSNLDDHGYRVIYGSVQLDASASSGLPVSFRSRTGTVCRVSESGVVTYLERGTCRLVLTQAGDATYAAADPVYASIYVVF